MKKIIYVCCIVFVLGFTTLFLSGCLEDDRIEILRVNDIELNETYEVLSVGESEMLLATVYPFNANNQNIIWTSTNPEVAQVEEGIVTGVGYGSVKIYAISEDGNFTDYCYVDVIN